MPEGIILCVSVLAIVSQREKPLTSIILASGSPRRAELLNQIGVAFTVQKADIDESPLADETPYEHVKRLALEKASIVQASLPEGNQLPVLGSDTIVVSQNQILGKPSGFDDFRHMMRALSGAKHEVMTAVAVASASRRECVVCTTSVLFKDLSDEEIECYWLSGEPADKAGGYGIQGLAACFIEQIQGSYSNVVGLPLYETHQLLREFHVTTWLDKKD